jgi:hypothetical protein
MKRCIIVVFLHFLFAGSTGQGQRPAPYNGGLDTAMVSRIAERMAYSWAIEKSKQIDSAFAESITGRIDIDYRPDGTSYAWIWKYKVIGQDTIYDTTMIKRIQ